MFGASRVDMTARFEFDTPFSLILHFLDSPFLLDTRIH